MVQLNPLSGQHDLASVYIHPAQGPSGSVCLLERTEAFGVGATLARARKTEGWRRAASLEVECQCRFDASALETGPVLTFLPRQDADPPFEVA
jgi:hypothetical protein